LVWIKFVICLLVIFFSGRKVARYGDIIAEKTGLGGVWVGLVLIAVLTSLPELFNGVSAVTLVDAPGLTVGNLLGANMFNLFNLALLDMFYHHRPLLSMISSTHRLTGIFSLILVLLVAVFIIISNRVDALAVGWIGWYSPLIIVLYAVFARIVFQYERNLSMDKEVELMYAGESSRKVYLYFSIAAMFIIGAGIWLAFIGDEIAGTYGWGESFVGSLFLGFTTTLPEITVSYAAFRIGAIDLGVANLIGSNLFNMTIISIDDVLYVKGPLLAAVSESHLVTAFTVIIMSLVFIAGFNIRQRKFFRLSWWNYLLVLLFFIGAYFNFRLS
jgi:cation:H+ antiporter